MRTDQELSLLFPVGLKVYADMVSQVLNIFNHHLKQKTIFTTLGEIKNRRHFLDLPCCRNLSAILSFKGRRRHQNKWLLKGTEKNPPFSRFTMVKKNNINFLTLSSTFHSINKGSLKILLTHSFRSLKYLTVPLPGSPAGS